MFADADGIRELGKPGLETLECGEFERM